MTQEEKKLLLEDLCARLPYGVIIKTSQGIGHLNEISLSPFGHELGVNIKAIRIHFKLEDCKPYLRPLSSMTEEEKEEFNTIWEGGFSKVLDLQIETDLKTIEDSSFEGNYNNVRYLEIITAFNTIQWLLSKHFDLGLIEKGLALEASNDMYK